MKKFSKMIIVSIFIIPMVLITGCQSNTKEKINVYLFWGDGCPHCEDAKEFFSSIESEYGKYFNLVEYEVLYNNDNKDLMKEVTSELNENVTSVPYIIIGNKSINGFSSKTEEELKNLIKEQYDNESYEDVVEKLK